MGITVAYHVYMSNLELCLETMLPARSRDIDKVTFRRVRHAGRVVAAASSSVPRPAFEPGPPARRRRQLDTLAHGTAPPTLLDMPGRPPAEANQSGAHAEGHYLKT